MGYGDLELAMMSARSVDIECEFLRPHLTEGMSVLDCGCGPGALTVGLAQIVSPGTVTGVDVEPIRIEEARRVAEERNVVNASFDVADVYDLPYDDNSFDLVFASALLGNVARPDDAVRELTRVLKDGGVIALREFDESANMLFPRGACQESLDMYQRLRTSCGHDPAVGRRLPSLLRRAGFSTFETAATFSEITDAEDLQEFGMLTADLFDRVWGPQAVGRSLADEHDVSRWVDAWRAFGQNVDAFFASAWVEATAVKPTKR